MRIEIENIAKVKKANIEIEGITIIAGFNGSGKSTVFKTLESMCASFRKLNRKVATSRRDSIKSAILEWDERRSAEDEPFIFFNELPDKFVIAVHERGFLWEELTVDHVLELLEACDEQVGAPEAEELYASLKKVIKRSNEEYCNFIIERDFVKAFSGQLNSLINNDKAKVTLQNGKQQAFVVFSENKLELMSYNQIQIEEPLYIETMNYLDLVTGRSIWENQTKVPFSALLESMNSEVTLEEYNKIKEAKEICEQIISEITHGELISTSDRQIKYKEHGIEKDIASGNIASGLKNILFIQKLLANGFLGTNTLLLIDEPEVNLHPDWQVKFAEILVLIYKKIRCKIAINTHSPYFMRAIESKLAEVELADKGKYYYMNMEPTGEFIATDVTGRTEIVYETMYKPLEEL